MCQEGRSSQLGDLHSRLPQIQGARHTPLCEFSRTKRGRRPGMRNLLLIFDCFGQGLHFACDCEGGCQLGRLSNWSVFAWVSAWYLLPRRDAAHFTQPALASLSPLELLRGFDGSIPMRVLFFHFSLARPCCAAGPILPGKRQATNR